jgi:hypothetical protein
MVVLHNTKIGKFFILSKLNVGPMTIIYDLGFHCRFNFLNLCQHESDFGIKATWHFFATGHGKSPCDGIGGTVKRIITKTSLQRPSNNQILTPEQMYIEASTKITGIEYVG